MRYPVALAVAAIVSAASGCSRSDASGTSAGAASAAASPAPARSAPPETIIIHPAPTGPILGIQAGKGVGPIFLGATVATIERQMQLPCDEKIGDVCRYFGRAVEFYMKDDKLERIHVERVDRPAGKAPGGAERHYGVFRGAIPPDVMLGMLPWAVHQQLGKPESVDKVADGGADGTAYVEHYKGMDLEFDKLPSGNEVLGGVWIPGAPPAKR